MKALNQFRLLMTVVLVVAACVSAQTIWDGTADVSWYTTPDASSYNITTAAQLAGLAELVNGGNRFQGKTITLGADIFLNDTAGSTSANFNAAGKNVWKPIGIYSTTASAQRPFSGEFAGIVGARNRRIYGLYIPDGAVGQGLFGYATGEIKNVDILVGTVKGTNYVGAAAGYGGSFSNVNSDILVNGNSYVGGVTGLSIGTMSRVTASGNITITGNCVGGVAGYVLGNIALSHSVGDISGQDYVGGLVGDVRGNIASSHSVGDVTGRDNVGGLAGYARSLRIEGTESETGYTTFSRGSVSGRNNVGGLIGYTMYDSETDSIINVYSVGDVSGNSYVGGLAGRNYGLISGNAILTGRRSGAHIRNAYSEGEVKGTANYVGGLVGENSYGSITSSYHIGGNVSGTSNVGGLAGGISGNVVLSYHTGGDVSGTRTVGGLIGGIGAGNVISSYAICDVTGEGDNVGGLAGYAMSLKIAGVNSDAGYTTFSRGNVSGKNYVGGLIGFVNGFSNSIHESHYRTDTITTVYSVGNVLGDGYVGGLLGGMIARGSNYVLKNSHSQGNVLGSADYVGGLVGSVVDGNIENSYHTGGDVGGNNFVGGLAGFISGNNSSGWYQAITGRISSSHFAGGKVSGNNRVGGLIGHISDDGGTGFVTSSYSISDVTGQDTVGGLIGYSSVRTIMGTESASGYTTFSKGNVSGRNFVGGLIGSANLSSTGISTDSIVNVYSLGNVSGTGFVGGLVGSAASYAFSRLLNIRNAYSNGEIQGSADYIGGLVGRMGSGNISTSHHSNGDVKGNNANFVGGLVGHTASSIISSYSDAQVTGRDTVGGLVGFSSDSISGSYALRSVTARNIVGGLAGYSSGVDVTNSYFEGAAVSGVFQVGGLIGARIGNTGTIDNCYSLADVTGDDNIGGLVGSSRGTISNSYAIGEVTGIGDITSAGNDNLGGLVGYAYNGSILKSFALGNVSGSTAVGGLAGRTDGGFTINQAYARGNVTAKIFGDDMGGIYAGGLVGYASGATTNTFTEAYSSGSVNAAALLGGLVGATDGSLTLTRCHFDRTTSGQSQGVGGGSPALNGNITSELKTSATFSGWDFSATWKIDESESYPYFQWQPVTITPPKVNAAKPAITAEPESNTVSLDAVYNLFVTAVRSDNGILSYQWYGNASPNTFGGTEIQDEINAEFTVPTSAPGTYYYYVVVTNTITDNDDGGQKTASTTSALVTVVVSQSMTALTSDRNIPKSDLMVVNPPAVIIAGEFTAGPNPVIKKSGAINFFWSGRQISDCKLRIYDASGNLVRMIAVSDRRGARTDNVSADDQSSRRIVGSWDLKDSRGRTAGEGTYAVRGTINVNGKKERVSLILSIR